MKTSRLIQNNSAVILKAFLNSGKSRQDIEDESGIKKCKFSKLMSRDMPINYSTAQKLIRLFGYDAVIVAEH